uniref:Mitochondrial FtsY n=1 Tax=Eukaryota sp. TaxID=1928008 RepID=A0A895KQW3_9EUKA|nr:mitochondrial FtsY [Eukaryota sp.]
MLVVGSRHIRRGMRWSALGGPSQHALHAQQRLAHARTSTSSSDKPTLSFSLNSPRPYSAGASGFLGALKKTQERFTSALTQLTQGGVNDSVLKQVEQTLVAADVGVETATYLVGRVKSSCNSKSTMEDIQKVLKAEVEQVFKSVLPMQKVGWALLGENMDGPNQNDKPKRRGRVPKKPQVLFVMGPNGVGKTTTIAKLCHRYSHILNAKGSEGSEKKVVLAAGDTFRAAAVEQLQVWGDRLDVMTVTADDMPSPQTIDVFRKAVDVAKSENASLLVCDTAGVLPSNTKKMKELGELRDKSGKIKPGAPDGVWIVIDATMGNHTSLEYVQSFAKQTKATGVVLTKLDSSSKGGVAIGICHTVGLPILYVGVGEDIAHLEPFDHGAFIESLLSTDQ